MAALTNTTLAAAVTANATTLFLTSGTGVKKGNFIRVDSEMMQITDDSTLTAPHVDRGVAGTAAVAHNILTNAAHGAAADFPATLPALNVVGYGASGAIAIPLKDSFIPINKATAAAMTIADPSPGVNGLRLTIMAETAAAHTVTSGTAGFNGADTAGDVATFGGAKGDNLVIVALGGQWNVVNAKNVTLG